MIDSMTPDKVYFGQKDFVQTIAIKTMIRDLNMPIEMVVCPTVREKDGLAMSSRNSYLQERLDSTIIYKALSSASQKFISSGGNMKVSDLSDHIKDLISTKSKQIDYVIVSDMFDASEFSEKDTIPSDKSICISVACKIGKTRLIDNIVIDSVN